MTFDTMAITAVVKVVTAVAPADLAALTPALSRLGEGLSGLRGRLGF